MAYYAFLDENNTVTEVIVGKDEGNFDWEMQYASFRGQACKRTSYNTHGGVHYDPITNEPSVDQSKAFRKNYAGVGYMYDPQRNAFIPPQPYKSWLLNETSCLWEAPVPYPQADGEYQWDDAEQKWVETEEN